LRALKFCGNIFTTLAALVGIKAAFLLGETELQKYSSSGGAYVFKRAFHVYVYTTGYGRSILANCKQHMGAVFYSLKESKANIH